jgi:WD40 repeat protein
MTEAHDPNRTVDVPSAPPECLNAGPAAGSGSPRSSLGDQQPAPDSSPRTADPLCTTDSVAGAVSTEESLPAAGASGGDFPAVPGYRVLREIARGGMGRVLAAYDLALDRDVALKVLLLGAPADRFVRESKITARLPHPGIPPVHALGTLADGSPFLAMKLIAGQTLADEIRTADRPRLLQVFVQVCQAVGFAHSRGVVHRDLKPANVMVGSFGEVQVMDWGLAKDSEQANQECPRPEDVLPSETHTSTGPEQTTDFRAAEESTGHQTQAGTVLGTPAYMAPEQARGEAADARTDVFALGGILCAILTGQPPFRGKSTHEVIRRAGEADLAETLARLDGCGADAEVVALCRLCLSPRPADRPADGQAVAAGLTAYLDGVQERLQAAERARAVAAEQRKRRKVQRMLAAAVVALATASVFGGLLVWFWQQAERAKDDAVQAQGKAETARQDAEQAQGQAETARQVAEKAQGREADARKAVERERAKLAVVEYGRSMEVALQEYREHNASAAVAVLDQTNPALRGWEYRYVHRLCHFDLLTLRGHTSNVTSAAYSPDGSRIVTASYDGTAKIWNATTGDRLHTLPGHHGMVWSAAYSPDGARIVTAGQDGLKVWDARTGAEVRTIQSRFGGGVSAAFNPDGSRIVAGVSTTVQVWNSRTGAVVHTLEGHKAGVKSVSFSADGRWIVSGSEDNTARVWEAQTGRQVRVIEQPARPRTFGTGSASFSPDSSRIVTASLDTAEVWDRDSGVKLLTLRSEGVLFHSASFSADGSRIVTGGGNTAKVWDAKTGTEIVTLEGHFHPISSVSFHPDGSRVLTASVDGTAKVWDARTNAEFLAFKGPTAGEISASFSPDGSRVLTAGPDRTAKIWDATTGAVVLTLKEKPETARFTVGGGLPPFPGPRGNAKAAWFSPDGSRVVTGYSADGKIQIWDAKKGVPILTFKGRSDGYVSPFSPDGSRVVTTGWQQKEIRGGFFGTTDTTARVWDTRTGREALTLRGHAGFVTSASFRGDGLRIVTTSMDRTAKVWDTRTGAELLTLQRPPSPIFSAWFHPNGTQVVTGEAGTATIWDATTGAAVVTLRGHTGGVYSAAFSPDGSRVVTASTDGTVKLWDATTGAEVLSLRTGGNVAASSASFSADGSRILTLGNGIKIWSQSPIRK